MIEIRFFPGERVSIIEPSLTGIIKQVTLYEGYRVLYTVRYWSQTDMYSADFDESELKQITPHPPRIGFTKGEVK